MDESGNTYIICKSAEIRDGKLEKAKYASFRFLYITNIRKVDENKSLCIDPFLIYELGAFEEQIGVSPSRPTQSFILEEYYDAYNNISYDNSTANKKRMYEPFISINNNIVSVNAIEKTHYIKPGKLNELKSGNGVLANISYQMGIIKYTIEDVAY